MISTNRARQRVFNLEVDQIHCYSVARSGVIVHNTQGYDDLLPGDTGPKYKKWNAFQAGTSEQFANRRAAAEAWEAYKEAHGIVTGSVRSQAARRQFLRSLANDPNTPSWMKQWLEDGRCPPGYEVDHIEPLSIGGPDNPANMRLQMAVLHDIHHKYYRPWEW